jgi:2-polyprenyl-3-methyl-5-hydroxy-6-metoxy-1,4-benzoquinol methylase
MKRVYEENINPFRWLESGPDSLQYQYDRPDRILLFCSISPFIDVGDTLLDIGCGGAREIRAMREFGMSNTVDIADYWQECLDFVKSKNLNIRNYYKCDLRGNIDIAPHDVVLCTEAIEHMDDPIVTIKKLKALACKRLIVTCPNGSAMAERQHIWQIYKTDLQFDGALVLEITINNLKDHLLAVYNI